MGNTKSVPVPKSSNNIGYESQLPKPESDNNIEYESQLPKPESGNNIEYEAQLPKPESGNNIEYEAQLPKPKSGNNIEYEALLIKELITSAKAGNFAKVFEIIGDPDKPKYDYLLNCIPEDRRWGILHQAVYFNKPRILERLLRYAACDKDMRTKRCTSDSGKIGDFTALAISSDLGFDKMAEILKAHESIIHLQEMPTYQTESALVLICNAIAAYKTTFHPKYISPCQSVFEILRNIFRDINTDNDRLEVVQENICDAMHIVSAEVAEMIKGARSRLDFYKMIIRPYTDENNYLYTYVSTAFRRQIGRNYKPTGDDMALGPYAVMYQMLLLFWGELSGESATTYRRMAVRQEDIDKYREGTVFVWPAFVSSSIDQDKANIFPTCESISGDKKILFVIDNSTTSRWQPKNIEQYSKYKENERTYPAGAKFLVKGVTENGEITQVDLVLLEQ